MKEVTCICQACGKPSNVIIEHARQHWACLACDGLIQAARDTTPAFIAWVIKQPSYGFDTTWEGFLRQEG